MSSLDPISSMRTPFCEARFQDTYFERPQNAITLSSLNSHTQLNTTYEKEISNITFTVSMNFTRHSLRKKRNFGGRKVVAIIPCQSVSEESEKHPKTQHTPKHGNLSIGVPQMGNSRISEEKGPFPPFSGFSRCSSHHPEKGKKAEKRAQKNNFGLFPGRAARHPLSPQLLHPPFAATRVKAELSRWY